MADKELTEYRVKPVTRYIVTRYFNEGRGCDSSSDTRQIGSEYYDAHVAYEVAHALCRAEHERLGYAPGDKRIIYPNSIVPPSSKLFIANGDLTNLD